MTEKEILLRLQEGNARYVQSGHLSGDYSGERRIETAREGQHPFAVVVCCSDSREIPEVIFDCGIGDLFVIRVAGNVIADHQLGSIEYAAAHLGCTLTLVLGHTHCGAVGAAMDPHGDPDEGYIDTIVSQIKEAIGDEHDERQASILNVRQSVRQIREAFAEHPELSAMAVEGAVYDIESGTVDFLK